MKRAMICVLAVAVVAGLCVGAFAAGKARQAKTYQVTGPVLEMSDDVIVVQKGDDKWELGRDKDTKVEGELKVGAKVTIMYRMKAASIEVK